MVNAGGTSAQEWKTIQPGRTITETKPLQSGSGLERGFDLSTTGNSKNELPTGSTGSTGSRQSKSSVSGISLALSIRLARTHSQKAMEHAKQLVDACKSNDFMQQFRLGAHLDDQLKLMWKHRKGRDDMWGKLLNFLQSAVKTVDYDTFVVEQACAVLSVTEMLASSHVDRDDIRSAKRLLADAKLDHWFGISEPNFTNKSPE